MSETKVFDVNEIKITGRIRAMRKFGNVLVMTINTRTVSRLYRKGETPQEVQDSPSIGWYGSNAAIIEEGYQVGDVVNVTARTQLVSNGPKDQKKTFYQDLVGTGISPAMKEIDEGFGTETNVGQYCNDVNEAKISGNILKRYAPNPNVTIITIESKEKERKSRIDVVCLAKNVSAVRKIEDGAHVCITGKVQTRTYMEGEKKKRTQSILCYNIAEA